MSDDETYADGAIAGFDPEYVTVDGVKTRYYREGEGEPVLLLHGGSWSGTTSANTWTTNLDGLGEHFDVLAPDRIATGMTENPTDEDGFTYESEFEHMMGFVEEMGLDEFHLVGQSRGAGLAGQIAVEYPERVKTLVIVNSRTLAPDVGDYGQRRTLLQRGQPTDTTSETYHADHLRHFYEGLSYTHDHITDDLIGAAAYMRRRPKAQKTAETLDAGARARLRETKAKVMDGVREQIHGGGLTMPVLIYWGRNDPTAPLAQGLDLFESIAQTNPNTRVYVVDRAGHMPYREHPEEFDKTVTTFINHWKDAAKTLEEVQPQQYRTYYDPESS